MKKTILFILVLSDVFTSCIREQELSYRDLKSDPGYFIECYLVPNELYMLSATKLQSLDEDYVLDYSLEFEVWIDSLRLQQGLFNQSGADYVYNYGHYFRFNAVNKDSVTLKVITPEKDTISGVSTIPDYVEILNAQIKNDVVSFDFALSNKKWDNYYMISINSEQKDTVLNMVRFLDYSHIDFTDTVSFDYKVEDFKQYESIAVWLRRMTKANYDYQISLENAKNANNDNLVLPSSLSGNLHNAIGIFTCYTCDSVTWIMDSE